MQHGNKDGMNPLRAKMSSQGKVGPLDTTDADGCPQRKAYGDIRSSAAKKGKTEKVCFGDARALAQSACLQ